MQRAAVVRCRRIALAVGLLLAAGAVHAERAYVKASGEVDLGPLQCEAVARGPNVKRLCYDGRSSACQRV